jgi:hypothetical protein
MEPDIPRARRLFNIQRATRVSKHADEPGFRHRLQQHFEKLQRQLALHQADPGQVTAWTGKADDNAERDRITRAVESDRDCRSRLFCSEGGRVAAFGYDDVDLAGDQLGSQGGQPI